MRSRLRSITSTSEDSQEKSDICANKKRHERNQKNHDRDIGKSGDISVQNNATHFDDKKGEMLNERACKAEKFKVVKYSLGPNEEYIAISTFEYDAQKRNKDNVSHIYQ
ncbi:hypothetical protein Tco_0186552 [Tanacetum coccineum]